MSDLTYSVRVGGFLEVGQKLYSEIGHLCIVRGDDLLSNRVDYHLASRRVHHKEEAGLTFVVGDNFIKVALQNYAKLRSEYLVLSLVSCDLHHVYKLWGRVLLDLEHQKADRVCNEVILWTGEPLDL